MIRKFYKRELFTGDVVLSSKSSYGIVLKNTTCGSLIKWFKNKQGEIIHKYRLLSDITEDLQFTDGSGRIIKVYRPTDPHDLTTMNAAQDKYLIWEETTKEMTVAEIEKALGYKVKIVDDKADQDWLTW